MSPISTLFFRFPRDVPNPFANEVSHILPGAADFAFDKLPKQQQAVKEVVTSSEVEAAGPIFRDSMEDLRGVRRLRPDSGPRRHRFSSLLATTPTTTTTEAPRVKKEIDAGHHGPYFGGKRRELIEYIRYNVTKIKSQVRSSPMYPRKLR